MNRLLSVIAALTILPLVLTALAGCDSRDYNIKIKSPYYIDTSDSVEVNGYNGYYNAGRDVIENEDGSYTIILEFRNGEK